MRYEKKKCGAGDVRQALGIEKILRKDKKNSKWREDPPATNWKLSKSGGKLTQTVCGGRPPATHWKLTNLKERFHKQYVAGGSSRHTLEIKRILRKAYTNSMWREDPPATRWKLSKS